MERAMNGSGFTASGPHREIDFPELVALLARGRGVFAGLVVAALAAGGLYCVLAPPVYRADALVQVETDESSVSALFGDVAQLLGAQAPVAAELEILRSRLVLMEAVERLGLATVAEPRRLPLVGGAIARWRMRDGAAPIGGGPGPFAWGAEAITLAALEVPPLLLDEWLTLRVTPVGYELLGPDGSIVLDGAPGQRREGAAPGGPVAIDVAAIAAAPGTEFRLMRRDLDELLLELDAALDIAERGKQSGIIGVSYEGPDRQRAADFVNALVEAHLKQNVARRSAEAEQSLAFLETQLPKIRQSVEAAEAALNGYRLRHGSADLSKETELILQHSVGLEAQRAQLEQNRQGLLQRFTVEHPVIRQLDAQLREIVREQAAVLGRVKQLPETQQDLLRLSRDAQANAEIYTLLLNSAQELQLARAGTIGTVRIIDRARPRWQPARPQPALVMGLSALLGIALGLLGVFVQRALRDGVDDPAEVERALGLPTYATVPYSRAQARLARAPAGPVPLLAQVDPGDPAIEALRSLRTSLHFAAGESRSNVLVLTGPTAGLGKSFLAANLGAVLGTAKKSVVLVDADLRRGRLHEGLGAPRGPGLSEAVVDGRPLDELLRRTPVPGLALLATGALPANPAELLMHERFAALLAELSRRFDHVLVDAPPVLAVTDAAIIGRLAGSALLVLKAGEHSLRAIDDSLRRLRQAGVDVKGSIFNQAGLRGTAYGYRYAYEYRGAAARKSA
jgi:tyrosine-protein kinase Etk/Wzc